MRDIEKLSNIEALADYLLGRADEKTVDEHWQKIYDAQTKEKDKDYVLVVETLFEWAWKEIKEVK